MKNTDIIDCYETLVMHIKKLCEITSNDMVSRTILSIIEYTENLVKEN